jgi:hypothetical protein
MEFKLPSSNKLQSDSSRESKVTKTIGKKMESVLILQPFGLGDLIFAQGIAHHYMKAGMRAYWPVVDQYIHHIRRAYPLIEWLPENFHITPRLYEVEQVKYDLLHSLVAPIRWSNTFQQVEYKDVMRAKYDMYGLDWTKWTESAQWVRDMFKEDDLMGITGADSGTPYNLISENWGMAKGLNRVPVDVKNGLRNIYITQLEGFSLFDWAKVMQNAEQIHFVSSSNIFLLELLEVKASEIHIYQRLPDQPHHRNYDYILRRHEGKYRFH